MPHDPAVEKIRTQILALIRTYLPPADASPFLMLPQFITGGPGPLAPPPWEALTEGLTDSLGQARPLYAPLAIALALRAWDESHAAGNPALDPTQLDTALNRFVRRAQAIRRDPTVSPAQTLAHAWLCAALLRLRPEPALDQIIGQLWNAAFARQRPAGHLHDLTADTSLDAFVYDEFAALHAAANLATEAAHHGNPALFSPVHRLALYHLENTQPDHTTDQPWGLAAFAMFGDTLSMAEQQLHNAAAALAHSRRTASSPITLALLADAWVTLGSN